ncbi:Glucan 1 3-beta-glucosidase [Ceratocystis platani]|uniref:Glucan 1 3-beta-glucosidase n=1 Tax=Ceratocystis fimbriata f. sp. platani TaxID=88771 RepID=A0A0F8BSH7_CERFI|nr:Glucan 1 3-beta-glucosidase [Ceratocystis platani]
MVSAFLLTAIMALGLFSTVPAIYNDGSDTGASDWWFAKIKRQGTVAYSTENADGYSIFRNVKDFGAKGDGLADDTAAINDAISSGNRCGLKCDSSTVTPAIIYFPPGTYRVSAPIVMYYYSHMVGDALSLPVIKATSDFAGMAVMDSDPYDNNGNNWFTNQNNFFRQVRNFVIDLTDMPFSAGAGIHWQVAQATSLQNIEFNMRTDGGEENKQQGIFMDNGSGGFMTDLTFNGGNYGAFFGNQQFTTRNLTFNNCRTAVYMNWNWAWTFHGVTIDNCGVGIDMGATTATGSILLVDSKISNTPIGIHSTYSTSNTFTNGTLILDNVDMSDNVPTAILNPESKEIILKGNQKIDGFVQGRAYAGSSGSAYQEADVSAFISVRDKGAKGDGVTDDTAIIQKIFDETTEDQIVYFDHGAYLITDTIEVPKNIKITGEAWPLIMAGGDKTFQDQTSPKPVFRVGKPGDIGNVEITELIFETVGAQPGAIMIEWNLESETASKSGLWDTHFRIGGSAGTQLQSDTCKKVSSVEASANPECIGTFLLFHLTKTASAYFENIWFWVADHELDLTDHSQINIYNGRGILIESTKGAWLWGTSSKHNVVYNYQLSNAKNVFMGLIQTETAYFQGNPSSMEPFSVNTDYNDPDFETICQDDKLCTRTIGLRAVDSSDILIYGASMYSFFDNYSQQCLKTEDCQRDMVHIDNSLMSMYGLTTKAAINMVLVNGEVATLQQDNTNVFGSTIALFSTSDFSSGHY